MRSIYHAQSGTGGVCGGSSGENSGRDVELVGDGLCGVDSLAASERNNIINLGEIGQKVGSQAV